MERKSIGYREVWVGLPGGERWFLRSVFRMIRGAKRSQVREVAQAAAKWECGIAFFIKVRLINSGRRSARNGDRRRTRIVDGR